MEDSEIKENPVIEEDPHALPWSRVLPLILLQFCEAFNNSSIYSYVAFMVLDFTDSTRYQFDIYTVFFYFDSFFPSTLYISWYSACYESDLDAHYFLKSLFSTSNWLFFQLICLLFFGRSFLYRLPFQTLLRNHFSNYFPILLSRHPITYSHFTNSIRIIEILTDSLQLIIEKGNLPCVKLLCADERLHIESIFTFNFISISISFFLFIFTFLFWIVYALHVLP